MKLVTDMSKAVHYGESQAGIVMHNFLMHLDQTFNGSSHDLFLKFFRRNESVSKWMIFSDYAINDKNKPNDVIVFSIFPYVDDFKSMSSVIDKLSSKDVKDLKVVKSEFIDFIVDSEILNISIIMDKGMKLDPFDERKSLETSYKTALNQVNDWIANHGENENYVRIRKAYNTLLTEIAKPGVNLRNIRNIEIVSNLVAYIAVQVCKAVNVEIIGWFSDRDNILSHKISKFSMPVIFDLAKNLFHGLMASTREDYTEEFVFGLPEATGSLWYDSFNRVPDLIAAALADLDLKTMQTSHDKFNPVLENVITNRSKCLIYKIDIFSDGFQTKYLPFGKPGEA